jgi:hypothetical protein
MCNLSEGVKQIGHEERIIISVMSLMKNLKLSLDQAMNALDIPEADRAYYANAINGK